MEDPFTPPKGDRRTRPAHLLAWGMSLSPARFAVCGWLLAIVTFAFAPFAHAEFQNFAKTSGFALVTECTDFYATPEATCSSAGSDFWSIYTGTASASAWGDQQGLHASAAVDLQGTYPARGPVDLSAAGEVLLQDWIYLPSYRSVPYNVFGYVSMGVTTQGVASTGGSAYTQLDLGGFTPGYECYFTDSGSCSTDTLVNFTTGFSLTLQFDVSATAVLDPLGLGYESASSSAYANFRDTSFISSLSFTDMNGNPLALAITTASDLNYPMAQPEHSAPEPGTLALLAIACVGLFVRRFPALRTHEPPDNVTANGRLPLQTTDTAGSWRAACRNH